MSSPEAVMSRETKSPTRAYIHLDNLRHNIRLLKNHLKSGVKICMAVKADGYGHGGVAVSRVALEEGVEVLGVATVEEGRELREAGIRVPVLLFSLPVPEGLPDIVRFDLHPVVAGRDLIDLIEKHARDQGETASVHLKIDTGMGRIGCRPDEADELAERVEKSPHLRLEGICTHLPLSDMTDRHFTERQIRLFLECAGRIRSRGIDPGILHTANSGAIIGHPESHLHMVRPGILMYGYYPSREQKRILPVKPLMEFRTKVVFLKRVSKGTGLSYGLTYRTVRASIIATLAAGYADGFSRKLSNRGEVVIRDRRYPVVGRICMDQCLADLGTGSPVRLYDDAVLFGPDPGCPDAEDIAELLGTIPYEVTCLVGKRVPRIYLDGG